MKLPTKEICQELYDNGMTLVEIANHFNTYKLKIQRLGIVTRKSFETKRLRGTDKHSDLTKKKLSDIALANGAGGKNYRKMFYYNGYALESSYELRLAQDLDKNNIKWIRPKRIKYTDQKGTVRHYTPDFYLTDYDVYLDPKNDYLISIDIDKIRSVMLQNSINILVLNNKQLTWDYIAGMV